MKWIIVTGCSGGLGRVIATAILRNTDLGIIDICRTDSTNFFQNFNRGKNTRYHHLEFDLSNPKNVKYLYLEKIRPIGIIQGLVNNAAYAYDDIVSNANYEYLHKMFAINVFSPILLTKYIIRDFLLNGTKGSLVHITSVSSKTGYKGLGMYGSTKGAMEAFSKNVAREWGGKGIRSNCVSPGFMDTKMSESLDVDQKERIYQRTALKLETDKSSVAATVSFLLSDQSKSITGEIISVDSGTI